MTPAHRSYEPTGRTSVPVSVQLFFASEKAMPRETLSHRLRQATLLRLDRLVGGCVTLWTFADMVLSTGCTLLAYSILEQDDRPRTDVVCFDLNCPSGIRSWRQSALLLVYFLLAALSPRPHPCRRALTNTVNTPYLRLLLYLNPFSLAVQISALSGRPNMQQASPRQ
jgi:hypothetical protein